METTQTKTQWTVDPVHSEIQFKVKHMVISTVTGQFERFSGSAESEGDDFEGATVTFEVEADSINTRNKDRDAHLKSDDFFNAEKYPKITFKSKSFTKVGDNNYKLVGDLTIRDVVKEVTLDVEYGGMVENDGYGNVKAGFEVTGKINRKDFGLRWNGVTEAGQIIVSDEVRLILNVQFAKVS
jgi:polyisoprenoid-binding protein YceI